MVNANRALDRTQVLFRILHENTVVVEYISELKISVVKTGHALHDSVIFQRLQPYCVFKRYEIPSNYALFESMF